MWPNLQPIQSVPSDGRTDPVVCTFKFSTNQIERNFGRNITTSQWIFGGQSDQTWTCVLNPDLDFGKRLDVLIHTHGSKFRYIISILSQNDTRLRFRAGRLVFSPRRTRPQASPTLPSWFWYLDVNFVNPYKRTAGFFFFDDKEDAKKTTVW